MQKNQTHFYAPIAYQFIKLVSTNKLDQVNGSTPYVFETVLFVKRSVVNHQLNHPFPVPSDI